MNKHPIEIILKQRGRTVNSLGEVKELTIYKDLLQGAPSDKELEKYLEKQIASISMRDKIRKAICAGTNITFPADDILNIPEITVLISNQFEKRFTSTFEWHVSKLLLNSISASYSSFQVYVQGAPDGGDLDVLAFTTRELIYVECKSGAANNISLGDLLAFKKRHHFLAADLSIFYMDNSDIERFLLGVKMDNFGDTINMYKRKKCNRKVFKSAFHNLYFLDRQSHRGDRDLGLEDAIVLHYALMQDQNEGMSVIGDSVRSDFDPG